MGSENNMVAVPEMVDPETLPGHVICHSSDESGDPDVGVTVGLGGGKSLWLGELLLSDGGDIGFVVHGPNRMRLVAPIWPHCEWQEVIELLRYHAAPALAATPDRSDDALAEENRRLREALEEIAGIKGDPVSSDLARVALKGDGL